MENYLQQYEKDYGSLVSLILDYGVKRPGRNGNTISLFGTSLTIDLLASGHFPVLMSRKLYPSGVLGELAAFLKGPKHLDDFTSEGCNYWAPWANSDGSIEVDYGNSWLDFNGVNQLEELVKGLKEDPYGRRHLVTGWDPSRLEELNLPCCHMLYQWYVAPVEVADGKGGTKTRQRLDMIWYQRSVDVMVGLPSDVILAAAWNLMLANQLGMIPGTITMMLGDTHIYESHIDNAHLMVGRIGNMADEVNPPTYSYDADMSMSTFKKDSIQLHDYYSLKPLHFGVIA